MELLLQLYENITISKKTGGHPPAVNSTPINFDTLSKENYNIISPSIREHIDSSNKTGRHYSFQLNGRNINLYIILPSRKEAKQTRERVNRPRRETRKNRHPPATFHNYYCKVFSILHFFIGQPPPANHQCSTELSIYLYLTDLKKKLPTTTGIGESDIIESNVNTGFTFGCSLKNEIYIFRKEEWEKVFIHESIHAFGMDFASYNRLNDTANRQMLEFFRITGWQHDLRLYEAYTETWASILNILFRVKTAKQIPSAIRRQQDWSINQYMKIMEHYNLDNPTAVQNEGRLILKEKVTLYSYYILKCRLLLSIDGFFDYCSHSKSPEPIAPINLINFIKTEDDMNRFINFIQKVYGERRIEETIRTRAKEIKERFSSKKFKDSLRMTV
jgi:hypothetical protein